MICELSKNLVFSDLILTSKLLIIALSLALNFEDFRGLILPF